MSIYVYVTISEEDRIEILKMDAETGKLDHSGQVAASGRPAPLAMNPERKLLFVGRRNDLQISSYQVDQATGNLSHIGEAPLESDPCFLSTDKTGKYLLSSYYGAGKVGVHSIGDNGVVGASPIEWLSTDTGAHSIQTDRSNRFAFVPHISGGNGPNLIYQFRFDEATGHLTPNSPPHVVPNEGAGPRHFCFHPTRNILYFTNEQECSVTAYNFDPSAGTLTAFQTVSTLPDGYDGRNSCAQIQISPTGKFLFAPNRGHNTIASFSIDASTGGLTPIEHTRTEPIPRAISLDPEGRFLFAAGLESGKLASYRVDGDTGKLEPLQTYDVGKAPMWVLITNLSG